MHSPKFPFKSPHLRSLVNSTRLQALWTNTIRNRLREQVLPDAVEYLDFHVQLKQRTAEIEQSVCSGSYVPSSVTRLLSEKSKGLCRQIVLPGPEEALILQALSDSLWETIRPKAPSEQAYYAPQDQPFSKVNKSDDEDEWGYGPIEAWLDFQKSILGFGKDYRFVVVTDIANYYDSIIHAFLRSILADYGKEREAALDLLLFLLDSMLWTPDYMPNFGIGLPQMDFDAPRLLAHTHLFEIDELFANRTDIGYARYMDDIDFGVESVSDGKRVLRDLDLALQTRNLRVNSGKTKILSILEAEHHFRVNDNLAIDKLEERISQKSYLCKFESIYNKIIRRSIFRGISTGRFEVGNGDKILKRLLSNANRNKSGVDTFSLRYILVEKPALRELLLKAWVNGPSPSDQLGDIIEFLHSGHAVDDLARIHIVKALLNGCYTVRLKKTELDGVVDTLDRTDQFQLWCRLVMLGRFGSLRRLLEEIEQTRGLWARHRNLVRTVAGFYGLFCERTYIVRFERIVRRFGGPEAVTLLDFHENLAKTSASYAAISNFLQNGNPSLPSGMSHPKSLMIASALNNPTLSKLVKTKLLARHPLMMQDIYYLRRYSRIMSSLP